MTLVLQSSSLLGGGMSNTNNTMSNKRSKTSDGHTMSKIDVQNELAKEQKNLLRSYKGYECSCGKCGEKFEISTQKNTLNEKILLTSYLTQGGCPSCNSWKTNEFHKMRNYLVEYNFEIEGKEIRALRIPNGFRPKRIIKTDDKGRALL